MSKNTVGNNFGHNPRLKPIMLLLTRRSLGKSLGKDALSGAFQGSN